MTVGDFTLPVSGGGGGGDGGPVDASEVIGLAAAIDSRLPDGLINYEYPLYFEKRRGDGSTYILFYDVTTQTFTKNEGGAWADRAGLVYS